MSFLCEGSNSCKRGRDGYKIPKKSTEKSEIASQLLESNTVSGILYNLITLGDCYILHLMSQTALVALDRRRGSVKIEIFNEWFITALLKAQNQFGFDLSRTVVIIDNAPSHAQIERAVDPKAALTGLVVLPLPLTTAAPSMGLSIFEFNKMANQGVLQRNLGQIVSERPDDGITKTEHRLRYSEGGD